jgi:menaquinone-dependent protoporphyrinogen IX oxidase
MTVLVAYASQHGSTSGIAEAIGGALVDHEVKAEAKRWTPGDGLGPYEAVVLVSAVYAGSWMKEVWRSPSAMPSTSRGCRSGYSAADRSART